MRGTLKVAYVPIALLGRTKLLVRGRHLANCCARMRGSNEECIFVKFLIPPAMTSRKFTKQRKGKER